MHQDNLLLDYVITMLRATSFTYFRLELSLTSATEDSVTVKNLGHLLDLTAHILGTSVPIANLGHVTCAHSSR